MTNLVVDLRYWLEHGGEPDLRAALAKAIAALESTTVEPIRERGPDFAALSQSMGNPCLAPTDDESFEAALVREAVRRLSENRGAE